MYDKKYIGESHRRRLLVFSSFGLQRFVPIIVILILVPLFLSINWLKALAHINDPSQKFEAFRVTYELLVLIFFPFFSCWWSILSLSEYVEADGRELFATLPKSHHRRDAFYFFLLSLALIAIVVIAANLLVGGLWISGLRLLLVCVFFFGLTFLSLLLFRSPAITILLLLMLTMLSFTVGTQMLTQSFPFYVTAETPLELIALVPYTPYLFVGIAFITATYFVKNKT